MLLKKHKDRDKEKDEEDDDKGKMSSNPKTFFSYPSFPSSPTAGGPVGLFSTRRQSGSLVEDLLIISGLVVVQIINAVYVVTLSPILSHGVKPLFLIIFGCTSTSVFVLPFAVVYERMKWPSRLSLKLICQFVLISLSGVTTFQALMLLGIEKTSPAIASAMPNLAPGIIFIIAACLRFEKVDINCKYSRAKILGTVICLGGAMTMSFLQSPTDTPALRSQTTTSAYDENLQDEVYKDWIIGCFYLLAAVFVVSCSTVLQAVTMTQFPAPFSLCSITSFLGAILTIIAQIATEGKIDPGHPMISLGSIIAIMLLSGMVIAICVSFQTWAVRKKGPVLVSMFSPIQTVSSAILSALFLGRVIKIASLGGMFIMFAGLYMVLWAKKKEGFILPNVDESNVDGDDDDVDSMTRPTVDVEKPLLC